MNSDEVRSVIEKGDRGFWYSATKWRVSGAEAQQDNEATLTRPLIHWWPDSNRTCNQTVMSGRILISFVDFAAFSFGFDCVCCVSFRLLLVQNWCGPLLPSKR
jgi:hypothetical protein